MKTHRTLEQRARLTWQITTEVRDMLDEHLAVPTPEHGAALLAVAGTRLVVEVIVDPRPGQAAAYSMSDALQNAVNERLHCFPGLEYIGTVHSHPHNMAEPSSQDHNAFRSTLRSVGRSIGLFPIVVQACRGELGHSRRFGDRHLVDLQHGLLSGFSAELSGDNLQVRPCTISVVSLGADLTAAATALGATASELTPVQGQGGAFLQGTVTAADCSRATVLLPHGYPQTAPLLRLPNATGFTSPVWSSTDPSVDQLIEALQPLAASTIRAGLEARLAHHLPTRADWSMTVVGCGSVGSHAAELLVRSGVRRLRLVDPDLVGPENLSRSTFTSLDLGQQKVEAVARRLRLIAPDVKVSTHASRLTELAPDDLTDCDVAVLAADDQASEAWLSHHLYRAGTPHVSIKMYARGEAGEVVAVVPDRPGVDEPGTPCLNCATGRRAPQERSPAVDYGTGRLMGELALGSDILSVTTRGVKVALALAARASDGPLADWINPLVTANRTLHLASTVDGWGIFAQVAQVPMDGPFASLWVRTATAIDCAVCGPDRAESTTPLAETVLPDVPAPLLADARRDWLSQLKDLDTESHDRLEDSCSPLPYTDHPLLGPHRLSRVTTKFASWFLTSSRHS